MKAVILAAGYATRLHPYTSYFPKTLIKIGRKTILGWTLSKLGETGLVDEAFVVTNDRYYPQFQSWAKQFQGIPVRLINDRTRSNEGRLGSLGDLAMTLEDRQVDEDCLVICSDKMFEFSLKNFIGYFFDKGEAVNTCEDVGDPHLLEGRHGCVKLDSSHRILDFQEKPAVPVSSVKSIAFYLFPRKRLPLIPRYLETGGNPDAPGHFAEWYHKQAPMYGWFVDGECWDVGDPTSLKAARVRFGSGDGVKLLMYPGLLTKNLLSRVLGRLADWRYLDIVSIGVPDDQADEYRRWFEEEPPPVPLEIIHWNQGDLARIIKARTYRVIVKIDAGAASFDFDDVDKSLDRNSSVSIVNGVKEELAFG